MDPRRLSQGADLLRLSTLGLTFVLCNFAGAGLGWLAVRYLGVGGWAVMVGLFFGILAGAWTVYEQVRATLGRKPPKGPDRQ